MPHAKHPDAPFQPNLYVVARFLDRLAEGKAWTRASLQSACGVNYDIFRRYLDLLTARGFLHATPDGRLCITAQGVAWRHQLRVVLDDFLAMPPGGG